MLDLTPLARPWARWRARRLEGLDPVRTQERQLMALVRAAATTDFGRDHGFREIASVADFQAAVPLRAYEDFQRDYWGEVFPALENRTWPGRIPYFALTSGTTSGDTKRIPVSREMVASNRGAGRDLLALHLARRPQSRLLGGVSFLLGGSTDLKELSPGIFEGDLSGIAAREMPWWFGRRAFPPPDLALIADWEEKIDRLARASLAAPVRALSGVPSWLHALCQRLGELRPGTSRLADWYPDLELLVHGGVDFRPYQSLFDDLLEGSRAETREVYPASEGFFALADRGEGEGLLMNLEQGIFFELVPLDELGSPRPTRRWLGDAEVGADYALAVSTCAGLWSYLVGDTVRLVSSRPARLKVTGRVGHSLSAFGEHLIGEEIAAAVTAASAALDRDLDDYTVGPLFSDGAGGPGGHLYVIELAGPLPQPGELDTWRQRVDQELMRSNQDYAGHRTRGVGLEAPRVLAVPEGSFAAWLASQGKLGGQHKVPRIINDRRRFEELVAFMEGRQGALRA